MGKDKDQLLSEIRYAIRLTQRTARFYRRIQSVGVFLSIVGGSATIAAVADGVPMWLTSSGSVMLTLAGAMLISVRPADKAAQNESDARRYQQLMARSVNMKDKELEQALEEAHIGDAQEIESLRDVAYNDTVIEIGRPEFAIPLSTKQQLLKFLA